jgi:tetratricopeptide (TPR) repeat protein
MSTVSRRCRPLARPSSSGPRSLRILSVSLLTLLFAAGVVAAEIGHGEDHDLGRVEFAVSCSAPAQAEFDRAVALLHHMTYPRAREAFARVAAIDPACAMAQWGVAMTLFQPLWPTRPGPGELVRGWEATQRARDLKPPTERERLFVAAAEAFFLEPESTDYWLRIRRWEAAMEALYKAYPDDPEAAVFYALAHLATAPADRVTRDHSDRAAAILLRIYERNPEHPGVMHYLIHANDVRGRERESLEITRRYETLAPHNPHALHMPTHIYTRLGDWEGVIRGNLRAAEAALENPAGDHGEWVWDEFPHATEYLVYAYLQQGRDDAAAEQMRRLQATPNLQPSLKTAFNLASVPARYALERRAWQEAAAIVAREPATLDWDRFAWPEAIARFAAGLGAAHLGRLEDARAALLRLGTLEDATRRGGEELFARNIQVLRLELEAWLAHLDGREQEAVARMRDAEELELSTPKHAVTPGPTIPAPELMGDLLLEQGNPRAALAAYERSLDLYPHRLDSQAGAARAAAACGETILARLFYRGLLETVDGASARPAPREAQEFLATATVSP